MSTRALLLSAVVLTSCSASVPYLAAGADEVVVSYDDPGVAVKRVGPITGADGSGCGASGELGDAEGAMVDLRNNAVALGADYVHVTKVGVPHSIPRSDCFDNTYVFIGVAYLRLDLATADQLSVIENVVDHDLPRSEAFARLGHWVAETYGSADDEIQLADASSGSIVVRGAYRSSVPGGDDVARYRMSIDVGEGSVRFRQQIEEGTPAQLASATLEHFASLRAGATRSLARDGDF